MVILVYKTDAQHSYASRDIIGVALTKRKAIKLCKEQADKEGCEIDEDQLFNLNNYGQTQGYAGDGEFDYEELETNILL